MQVNLMSSQQVWPQLAAPPVSELQSQLQSQPLLQAARGGYPDGSLEPLALRPLALRPLAAPLQLRMMNCGGGVCTLHTGFDDSTSATQEHDWKHRDKDETDCCSKGTVREAFCYCDPFLCCQNITHFIF
jgi:hypothetical protein